MTGLLERAALVALDPPPAVVVLDLERVGFLGASGVTALVAIQDAVERAGGRVCLQPSNAVERVLEIVGMGARFHRTPALVAVR